MDLILVRHALPVRTEPVPDAPRTPPDPELSAAGQGQAALVCDLLARERVDAIYSSPLVRAVRTVEPLAARLGLPVRLDEGLHEIDFGEDSYIPIEELVAGDPREQMFRAALADQDSELIRTFRAGVASSVRMVVARHPGATVVLACHGGVVNAVLADLLGLAQTFAFDAGYASVTRVRVSRAGTVRIRAVNDQAHLQTLDGAASRTS